MPTAILIDGAYFVKRFQAIEPHNAHNATRGVEWAHRRACAYLTRRQGRGGRQIPRTALDIIERKGESCIVSSDCPPLDKKMQNPVSKKAVDFGKSAEARFRLALHEELREKRKVALIACHLSAHTQRTIKLHKVTELLAGKIQMSDLGEDDVTIDIRQKGVDMRIGVDVSSLAFKKQVDQIILIAGDADFVPAAKKARREGIDFVLDPMWQNLPPNLNEHIDGLRPTCPQPARRQRQE